MTAEEAIAAIEYQLEESINEIADMRDGIAERLGLKGVYVDRDGETIGADDAIRLPDGRFAVIKLVVEVITEEELFGPARNSERS